MQKHWIRIVCDEEIHKFISNLNYKSLSTLEISGKHWQWLFPTEKYDNLYYPEFDISQVEDFQKTYDLIILEHVLEHIPHPSFALKNIYRLLNPGGHLIVVTPFLVKLHLAPKDCTRWTGQGLKYFISQNGFDPENITVGQWGNKSVIIANLNKWIKYNPLIHSLENDEQFPAVVWAFAKK